MNILIYIYIYNGIIIRQGIYNLDNHGTDEIYWVYGYKASKNLVYTRKYSDFNRDTDI